jgi:hypothetical protein
MRALLPLVAMLSLQAQTAAQRFTLPNGLLVVLLEDHDRPLLRARLHLRLDAGEAPSALILAALEGADAGRMKPDAFEQALEGAGLRLHRTVEPGGLAWRLTARSRDQDRALGLAADRVTRPVFPAGTPVEVRAWRARVLRPERAVLVLQGDLGLDQARRLALLHLGTWTPATTKELPAAVPEPQVAVATPTKAVATLPPDQAPEAPALLTLLLAEDPALAPVQLGLEGRELVASLAPGTPPGTALADALETQRRRTFTEAELALARAAWKAGRARASLHPEARMDAALAEALGQAISPARLDALTPQALREALGRWLEPGRVRFL